LEKDRDVTDNNLAAAVIIEIQDKETTALSRAARASRGRKIDDARREGHAPFHRLIVGELVTIGRDLKERVALRQLRDGDNKGISRTLTDRDRFTTTDQSLLDDLAALDDSDP
jgi:hypothetical protein